MIERWGPRVRNSLKEIIAGLLYASTAMRVIPLNKGPSSGKKKRLEQYSADQYLVGRTDQYLVGRRLSMFALMIESIPWIV